MPKTLTILEVFLASPSDLSEERKILEEVLNEFNSVWGDSNGVRLELLKWENNTHPGFGDDPQAVINEQIGDKYDIFIGIMWGKFGAPTMRSGSGTEEEFERAYHRFEKDARAIQLMFYFKDAPIPPSEIDTDQLTKVQAFKKKISSQYGGLYQQFLTSEDFEKLIRIHLSKLVQESLKKEPTVNSISPNTAIAISSSRTIVNASIVTQSDEDDEGIIDLSERATDAMQRAVEIIAHMSETISDLGTALSKRTLEIENAKNGNLVPDNKVAKRIANGAATDTDLYAQRMSVDLPALQDEYSLAMESFGRLAMMSGTDLNEPTKDIQGALDTFRSTRETMSGVVPQVQAFRDSIAQTPRMTTAYNKARKRAVAVTDGFLAFIETAKAQSIEVEKVIQEILDKRLKETSD